MGSSEEESVPWTTWFCSLRGNEYFCEIPHDYFGDFNLAELDRIVPCYRQALKIILDQELEPEEEPQREDKYEPFALILYGLTHVRYILSQQGMAAMMKKFERNEFGYCPRFFCANQPMMPIGLTDIPGMQMVKLYCPKCNDVFHPKSRHQKADGAYFGMSFPHSALMSYPQFRPQPPEKYEPRLYGFKIHPSAVEMQVKVGEKLREQKNLSPKTNP